MSRDPENLERVMHSEPATHTKSAQKTADFKSLRGLGLGVPLNPEPRFQSDDELWEPKATDGSPFAGMT